MYRVRSGIVYGYVLLSLHKPVLIVLSCTNILHLVFVQFARGGAGVNDVELQVHQLRVCVR